VTCWRRSASSRDSSSNLVVMAGADSPTSAVQRVGDEDVGDAVPPGLPSAPRNSDASEGCSVVVVAAHARAIASAVARPCARKGVASAAR